MNAKEIIDLLAVRHSDAVFVPECRDGPTWGTSHLRLDAWVMEKSWAKPNTIGYEVKVSRADFALDDKWHGYLPLCNQFYFVCPWGMIARSEIHEGCGLLYVTKNGEKLRAVRQAPRRDIEVPDFLYRYVLMNRVEICERNYKPQSNSEYWAEWLAGGKSDELLGRSVSKVLHSRVNERIKKVNDENQRLRHQNNNLEKIKKALCATGISYEGWVTAKTIAHQLREARAAVPSNLPKDLREIAKELDALVER